MPDMSDAEGEAVLIVLGPQLEWHGGKINNFEVHWAMAGVNKYRLERWSDDDGYAVTLKDDLRVTIGNAPELLPTLELAKRACEIHAATGKWEL